MSNPLQAIERQAAAGITEAAALILVVDGQTGVTSSDEEVVSWLRKTHPRKPVSTSALASRLRCSRGSPNSVEL
jgi:predicted GTPase